MQLLSNNLTGVIPASIGNLTKLSTLYLFENKLSGSIPQEIGMLVSLTELIFFDNNFSGSIPASIGNLTSLSTLYLDQNMFSGSIPASIGNMTKLVGLSLLYIFYQGQFLRSAILLIWNHSKYRTTISVVHYTRIKIPPELKHATQLQEVDVSSNHLMGEIPKELEALTLMFNLLLSGNQLSGKISSESGVLSNLRHLNLASNNLSGQFLIDLENALNLSQNLLIGEIPQQVAKLLSLEMLDLSHNMRNGSIPNSFNDLQSLTVVNISCNQLVGPIPNIKAFHEASFDTLRNNNGLCGNATGLMHCVVAAASNNVGHRKSTKFIIFIVLSLFGLLLLLFIMAGSFFILCQKNRTRKSESMEAQLGDFFTLWGYNGRILYENIIEATEDFSSNNFIQEAMELFIKLCYPLVRWLQ
ncbi:probable leucine-rich repeat receptor-like protein kinase At1g35710 [Durio zibethinus]|uniref:Probable leucine-rich repeat receptor-like protein kinase At1g35710 n=1 Tax=Durio zibethinus TaxID=66656 RepID=A0A6P6A5B8_DURZI|nr:probable leucine-rich repeat receptor-like protein kinase At1g35710 [Durio zibethinus]